MQLLSLFIAAIFIISNDVTADEHCEESVPFIPKKPQRNHDKPKPEDKPIVKPMPPKPEEHKPEKPVAPKPADHGEYQCSNGIWTSEARKLIEDTHNNLRSQLAHGKLKNKDGQNMKTAKNMYKLTYSCEVEAKAQSWANGCKYGHTPRSILGFMAPNITGQNIFASSPAKKTDVAMNYYASRAIQVWWEELPKKYLGTEVNLNDTVWSWHIGHFAQMAWARTHNVGCGISFCPNIVFLVCNYFQGDIGGMNIYDFGHPCKVDSDCTTFSGSTCSVSDGLCIHP